MTGRQAWVSAILGMGTLWTATTWQLAKARGQLEERRTVQAPTLMQSVVLVQRQEVEEPEGPTCKAWWFATKADTLYYEVQCAGGVRPKAVTMNPPEALPASATPPKP